MPSLDFLQTSIKAVIRNDATLDSELLSRINNAVSVIAGGLRLPDGRFSPPLPDLYKSGTVATTTKAYADLPADYQRNVFYISDGTDKISPPAGGNYYSFMLFLNSITEKDLSETGSIYSVVVKGKKVYYQGIPSVSEDLIVMYYRKPVDMSAPSDEPDGIPVQFQTPLIKHYVCADIFGDILGDSKKTKYTYHSTRFYKTMIDLIDFIGESDAEPMYYK